MPQQFDTGVTVRQDRLVPLCVDLDDTLIRSDILWESIVQLWRSPVGVLRVMWALLLGGKAAFKTLLAETTKIDPASLPYREDVLEFVRSQRNAGRDVVLATATHRIVAQRIADHLGLFVRVFATDGGINLSGAHKRAALQSVYGKYGFDYVGDNQKDLAIFSVAREALLVSPSRSLLGKASALGNVSRVFSENQSIMKIIAQALRLHQWAKNILLTVPLLTAHMVLNLDAWISVIIAFFGFSFVASATYVVNDLIDLQSDRLHAQKRFRPLASGRLSIPAGLMLAITLGLLGFTLSIASLPLVFVQYLAAYAVLTLAYSFALKRQLLVDVLALAVLYTLRILAGGVAMGVVVSEWLLMFSFFVFLSLAFLKRFVELKGNDQGAQLFGRGYFPVDLETMRVVGVCSGLLSALVLSLYISSAAVSQLYQSPQVLWFLCPLLVYWIARIWFLADRGEVHHDPVVFALLDWRSYVVGACGLVIIILAKIVPVAIHSGSAGGATNLPAALGGQLARQVS
jgi:4-hydroxybenzoate polyprenyltransferase